MGLLVPCDLVRMSLMPAVSMTARMAPPEITPVPGAAGLSMIRAEPSLRRTSCGIVVPTMGTVIMLRLATSMPLRIASVTSRALPMPAPTRPFMSPTTISALNEDDAVRELRSLTARMRIPGTHALKLQSGFARGVCQGLDSAVIKESTAVEHDAIHTGGLRLGGNLLADLRGLGHAVALGLQLDRGRGGDRLADAVVYD